MVDYFISRLDSKDFTILEVRQELEKNKIPEEEIRIVVKLVDNELHRRISLKSKNYKSKPILWVGASITGLGILITAGTYFNLIDTGDFYVIAYGPILGGLSIFAYGLNKGIR